MERVIDESTNGKAVSDAQGLFAQLNTFSFVLCTNVLAELLQHTHIVSKYLQSEELDLQAAISTIQATVTLLKDNRNEIHFKKMFDASIKACENEGIEIPSIEATRQRKVSRRLDENWLNEHQFGSIEAKYRVEFYYDIVDVILEQIDHRFSQSTQQLLKSFSCLAPEVLLNSSYDPSSELNYLCTFYEIPVDTMAKLYSEYCLFRNARVDLLKESKTILQVLQILSTTGFHRVYPLLYRLYRIFVTLPITSASCERCFSKLTIVKNKLRSTSTQDRLESLMILFTENDLTQIINFSDVIDVFARLGPRRLQL